MPPEIDQLEPVGLDESLILFIKPKHFSPSAAPRTRLDVEVLKSGDEDPSSVWVESRCGGSEALERLEATMEHWRQYGYARFTPKHFEEFEIRALYTPFWCEKMPGFEPAHASLFGVKRGRGDKRLLALRMIEASIVREPAPV